MVLSVSPRPFDSDHTATYPSINIPTILKNRIVFFTGYPGSGKGTQGKVLAKRWNVIHLSTGELFRAEAKKKTEVGLKMAEYMDKGEVIPKEIVFSYLRQELSDPKYRHGFILDGYPKTLEFLEHLKIVMTELDFEPLAALHFDISRETAIKRLTGRLHCGGCNRDFHRIFLPPKRENACDNCDHDLEGRSDDTVAAIEKRLNVFDFTTRPVIQKFEEEGYLFRLDASKPPQQVETDITSIISRVGIQRLQQSNSYFLRKPVGTENSSIFHNHVDAQNFGVLHAIIERVEAVSRDFQNKIYPIQNLQLGPQVKELEFASVYDNLPNFHPINGAIEEAFSTGKMGSQGFNYDQIRATLEATFAFPQQGVMTELEEDIFSQEFDIEGRCTKTLDRGLTLTTVDWSELPGWEEKMIANVPRFELHHGFEIKKGEDEEKPPIDVANLSERTTQLGFQTGGWFIFRKKSVWAYRSNEFSNQSYESSLNSLQDQALRLRTVVAEILPNQQFTSGSSLEKVHAIWRVL